MHDNTTEKKEIKAARSKFIAMATTYCLGVLNDNYFKQAALLLAVTAGMSHLQGIATALFALPFILCSSYAGWVADRYAKKNVVIASKGLECVAMLIGAAGIIFTNWPCILAMVFLMGLQSTFFSPALNGSIPELYPETYVAKANGTLKLVTTLAILAGIATAGITLDADWPAQFGLPTGTTLVAIAVILISFMGFFASFGVFSKPAPESKRNFPKFGPISSLKDVYIICKDRQILIAIFADTYFYFVASIAILTINTLGLRQLGLSQTVTSLITVFLMLGVCAGSLTVARIIDMKKWNKYLITSSLGMVVGLFLASFAVFMPEKIQAGWLIGSLIFVGFAGGMFLIPVTSFLQIHPERSEKGRVLATTNFCGFVGIMLSGFVFSALDSFLSPSAVMAAIGVMAVIATVVLVCLKSVERRFVVRTLAAMFRFGLSLRYKVEVKGLDTIKTDDSRGTIFLPNHPALIDPVLVMTHLYSRFEPRPLSDSTQANKPVVRQIMKLVNPITIPNLRSDGRESRSKIVAALKEVAQSLENKDQVVFYPAGRVYRSRYENLAGNSGVEYILKKAPSTRVVLVRTTGLWGSSFGRAGGGAPSIAKQVPAALKFLLANAIFFGPRRKVCIEFIEDSKLQSLQDRDSINRYLEELYNHTSPPRTAVPNYWWQGRKPTVLPEPEKDKATGDLAAIPVSIRKMVMKEVERLSGTSAQMESRLSNDLSMDSLTQMELAVWIESEFGTVIEDVGVLETVQDCVFAAAGILVNEGETEPEKVSKKWLSSSETPLTLGTGERVTSLFLQKALTHPKKIILADRISGAKTYEDMVTAIFLLKPIFEKIPAQRVGIMLPPSVSATIVYFATLFSGKTPVMYNWTVGVANMKHGIEQTGASHIITAKALVERLKGQGMELDTLPCQYHYLEEVIADATMISKLKAKFQAVFTAKRLRKAEVTETATILFTSGSESMPKAVPLSHENIITNLKDFSSMLSFAERDSLLGMLPPFHSLGLTGTVIMSPCLGLRTVYHPNPTEPVALAKLTDTYQVSTVIGTPTFINGILQVGSKEQLSSLRLVFTGAEKCPESVYKKLQEINREAVLCEGYGITECSPLVSLNTKEDNRPGTIGRVVPSTEFVVIDPETEKEVSKGERGLLLLRGKNIFKGYLNDNTNRGFQEYGGQLWYQTGDFVRESEDGVLTFSGRKKRFIKLAGEMISLPAIENVLLKHFPREGDGVPLAIETTPSEEHPEVVLFSTEQLQRERVNKVLKEAGLSPLYNVRKIIEIDEIPVLGTGKTNYKQLKEMLTIKN